MRFYTTEQISPRLGKTPEGFLVAYDVPINRTGEMVYNKAEVDVMPWLSQFETDSDGNVRITREADEVFRPETLKSFEGKPVTIDHPDQLVTPKNWKEVTKGYAQNVRRGEREQSDLTLADLVILDPEAIQAVESGELRQISSGYDADYEAMGSGRGRQHNIIGNHIALVQRGRAGARCQIMDSNPCTGCGECKCKTNEDRKEDVPMTFKDRLIGFLKKKGVDTKTLDEMKEDDLKELEKKETNDADEIGSRLDKIEKTLDALQESDKKLHETIDCLGKTKDSDDGDDDEETKKKKEEEEAKKSEDKKTKDAAFFKDSLSRTEILKPGYKPKGTTTDELRREVLEQVYTTDEGKALLEPFVGKDADLSKIGQETIDAAFIAASELVSFRNNAKFITHDVTGTGSKPATIAGINKANADFWQSKRGR